MTPSPPPSSQDSISYQSAETLRTDLELCLDAVQAAGSFAIFEPLPSPVTNPGLWIKGAGTIGLPLSERDAKAIIDAAHRAPYGKGAETLVDVNVRKTWELEPGDFEIRNPEWTELVRRVLRIVAVGLGVAGGIAAELYKMLLYDEGAMFKPHQDSEKAPNMFGTLVICLPSLHEGGEVQLTHMGHTTTFETAKCSEFSMSFMAWYSDVFHEIKPIKSGYRLVLTYNLCFNDGAHGDASAGVTASERLSRLMSNWSAAYNGEEDDVPELLTYKLEHQYTNANLSFSALKGHDREVAKHLKAACSETGSHFYLADLEKCVIGDVDDEYQSDDFYGYGDKDDSDGHHTIVDVHESNIELPRVVDLNGVKIAEGIRIDEEQLIPDDIFDEDREPDDEDYEGYTGNAGASATHFYRDTVAVIIPRGARVPVLLHKLTSDKYSSGDQLNMTLNVLFQDLSIAVSSASAKHAEPELVQLCNLVVSELKKDNGDSRYLGFCRISTENVVQALKFSVKLCEKQMFIDILDREPRIWPSEAHDMIGEGIAYYGFEATEIILNKTLKRYVYFESRYRFIENVAKSYNSLNLQAAGFDPFQSKEEMSPSEITSMEAEMNKLTQLPFYKWTNEQFKEALSHCQICSIEDGEALVKVAVMFGTKILYSDILPRIKKNASSTDMVIAFITKLFKASKHKKLPYDVVLGVCRDIIQDLIDAFNLQPSEEGRQKRQRLDIAAGKIPNQPTIPTSPPSKVSTASKQLAKLLIKCLSLGLVAEVDQLITKILSEASKIPLELFHTYLLPFLKQTLVLLTDKAIDLSQPRFQLLYENTLKIYISRYVAPAPTPPIGWSRPLPSSCPRSYRCDLCPELDTFLLSPARQTIRISRKEKDRQHLERRFSAVAIGDFEIRTERNRSLYTLVITKRAGVPGSFRRKQRAWEDQREVATLFIKWVCGEDQAALRGWLGDEDFEDLLGMRWLSDGAVVNGGGVEMGNAPLRSKEVNMQAQAAGTRGRTIMKPVKGEPGVAVEVIDLTDD